MAREVKDAFEEFHPIINLGFFLGMIVSTMLFFDMVFIPISFFAAFTYGFYVGRKKFIKMVFIFVIPVMVISIIVNLYTNQLGSEILFYFLGREVYYEALIYGLITAMSFGSILMWFYAYNYVVSSDKFLYVFGKIIPTLSLVFSMVLRFIPLFHKRATLISTGQKCIGHDMGSGTKKERARHGVKILSIMTTWSLENSIDTSDSMKARGYGLPGRSSYTQFVFSPRDGMLMAVFVILLGIIFAGIPTSGIKVLYYPEIYWEYESSYWPFIYIGAAIFAFYPILLNLKEAIRWKYLESKI